MKKQMLILSGCSFPCSSLRSEGGQSKTNTNAIIRSMMNLFLIFFSLVVVKYIQCSIYSQCNKAKTRSRISWIINERIYKKTDRRTKETRIEFHLGLFSFRFFCFNDVFNDLFKGLFWSKFDPMAKLSSWILAWKRGNCTTLFNCTNCKYRIFFTAVYGIKSKFYELNLDQYNKCLLQQEF